MDIDDLIKLATNAAISEETKEQFAKRFKEREKEFQKEADSMKIDQAFLNREYLI